MAWRRLLPEGTGTTRRVALREPTPERRRDQRYLLFAPARRLFPDVAGGDAGGFRLPRPGRTLRHAPEEAARRGRSARQLLRLRAAGTGAQDWARPLARAGEQALRPSPVADIFLPA